MIGESEKLALVEFDEIVGQTAHTPSTLLQLLNFAASSHNYAMCQCQKCRRLSSAAVVVVAPPPPPPSPAAAALSR